jgi:redox-regulated HSP33 family molecular chaperone
MDIWVITKSVHSLSGNGVTTTLYKEARPYGFANVVAFDSEEEARRFATHLNTSAQVVTTVYVAEKATDL